MWLRGVGKTEAELRSGAVCKETQFGERQRSLHAISATSVNCSAITVIPMKGRCGSVRSVFSGLIRSGMTDYKQCICARSCPSVSTCVA